MDFDVELSAALINHDTDRALDAIAGLLDRHASALRALQGQVDNLKEKFHEHRHIDGSVWDGS